MTLRTLGRALWVWGPAVGCVAAIHYGSAAPRLVLGAPIVPHSDKVLHAAAYGLFAVLLARAVRGSSRVPDAWVAALAFVAATLWGGIEECLQMAVPTRSCELADALANAVGAALAAAAWLWVTVWLARRRASSPR